MTLAVCYTCRVKHVHHLCTNSYELMKMQQLMGSAKTAEMTENGDRCEMLNQQRLCMSCFDAVWLECRSGVCPVHGAINKGKRKR